MSVTEVLVALAILVGLVGILVPILPGSILILAALLVWALDIGTTTGWAVFAVATVMLVVGNVVKYTVPGRRLKSSGVPSSTTWAGVALGVVGFFVVPVVGLFIGFVLGVYLAERVRVGGPCGLALDQGGAAGRGRQHPHRARRRGAGDPGLGRRRRGHLRSRP